MEPAPESLADFLTTLPSMVQTTADETKLCNEISIFIDYLRRDRHYLSSKTQQDVQTKSIHLWNAVLRVTQDPQNDHVSSAAAALARALVFWLLCGSTYHCKPDFEACVRLLKIAISAAASCLLADKTNAAQHVLERAGEYHGKLVEMSEQCNSFLKQIWLDLDCRYHCSRMSLACKQGKYDLATTIFTKVITSDAKPLPESVNLVVSFGLDAAQDRSNQSDWSQAIRWSRLTIGVLDQLKTEGLEEMIVHKFTASQILVNALGNRALTDDFDKARALIYDFEQHYAQKPHPYRLHLNFLESAPELDVAKYAAVLGNLLQITPLADSYYKTVMRKLHHLQSHDPFTASKVLDEFIEARLNDEIEAVWREGCFLTRVSFAVTQPNASEGLSALSPAFETIATKLKQPIRLEAAQAALMLLWKAANDCFAAEQYQLAEGWCRLCEHKLISADDGNLGKVQRRLLLCLFKQGLHGSMIQEYERLPECTRRASSTQLMMFRMAARDSDETMSLYIRQMIFDLLLNHAVSKYLDSIVKDPETSGETVVDCLSATEESRIDDTKDMTIQTMRILIQQHKAGKLQLSQILQGLRYTLELLIASLHEQGKFHKYFKYICELFEEAFTLSQKTGLLEWFSTACLQTIFKFYDEADAIELERLVKSYKTLIDPHNSLTDASGGQQQLERLICDALLTTKFASSAWQAQNQDKEVWNLRVARDYATAFRKCYLSARSSREQLNVEIVLKLCEKVCGVEFAAAMKLMQWNDLPNIVHEATETGATKALASFADGILASDAPSPIVFQVIQQIVNASAEPDNFEGLSRWLRILYTVSLKMDSQHTDLVVRQASVLAVVSNGLYPQDELAWLATSTFNRAIDAYVAGDDVRCRKLADQACDLAAKIDDGRALRRTMDATFNLLEFDSSK